MCNNNAHSLPITHLSSATHNNQSKNLATKTFDMFIALEQLFRRILDFFHKRLSQWDSNRKSNDFVVNSWLGLSLYSDLSNISKKNCPIYDVHHTRMNGGDLSEDEMLCSNLWFLKEIYVFSKSQSIFFCFLNCFACVGSIQSRAVFHSNLPPS